MSRKTPHTPHDFADQEKTTGLPGVNASVPVYLKPGKLIMDKFEVIELLGSGGMGTVFKVQHQHLKTFYALKCLNHKQGNDAIWRRFENEARAANRLDHPNLIKVHDSGLLPDGQPYFVMDLVDGITLGQVLAARGTITLAQALKIFIQVGFALSYAHTNGVIHRDIKPSNIMLVHNETESLGGTVKVVDFGIAKLTGKDEYNQQTLTKTGEIFGSPLYMSPEQCLGTTVDHRADLYSLGCVMYEALTGAPPMVGDNALTTMLKHQNEIPIAMRQASLGKEFPESIEYVVSKLLEKDPDKRYQNANLLTADLVAIEQGHVFKEQEFNEATKTLIALERASTAHKKVLEKKTANPLVWGAIMLAVGFALGFLAGHLTPASITKETSKKPESQEKIHWYERTAHPDVDIDSKNLFPYLDSRPFSTLKDGGKTRLFNFPSERIIGTICRNEDWMGPFIPMCGLMRFENFTPLAINLDLDAEGSPIIFEKFRQDEISGIKIGSFSQNLNSILQTVSGYKNLRDLELPNTSLDSSNIPTLKKLTKLQRLNVANTSISSKDLLQLPYLLQLKSLDARGSSDVTVLLEKLKNSKNLVSLGVAYTRLSENDLITLGGMKGLNYLDLTNNKNVNDLSIKQLEALQNLKTIDLEDCNVTIASLPSLARLKNVSTFKLPGKSFSDKEKKVVEKTLSKKFVFWVQRDD